MIPVVKFCFYSLSEGRVGRKGSEGITTEEIDTLFKDCMFFISDRLRKSPGQIVFKSSKEKLSPETVLKVVAVLEDCLKIFEWKTHKEETERQLKKANTAFEKVTRETGISIAFHPSHQSLK